ncbi:MAG: c-type cytochrome [Bacteroidales bacterium]|nr:c-type cytochrome [Bacteroidales bacterium]
MQLMNEGKYIRKYQIAVIIASSLLILLLFFAWIISGPGLEWRGVQKQYMEIIDSMSDSLPEVSLALQEKGIYQYELTDLGRKDRCVTCHIGIENPYMKDSPQPYRSHPGNYLTDHPPEKYGCTICHGGQGRALKKKDAFGQDPETHWNEPVLTDPYLESSCGKCHLSIYNEKVELAGTDIFQKGQEIFNREGCLGCHKARGMGGIVGPDLTEQGEKTKHDYSFQNIQGDQTISNWLKEHFKDPEMVSPGSQMLKIDLPDEDLEALATFVLGLAKPEISFEYFSLEALSEFKGERDLLSADLLFSLSCTGCHGKDGTGKSYAEYKTGVPAIMSQDFRRVASEDFIRFTMQKGRSRRQMSSWMESVSGMKEEEIDALARMLNQTQEEADKQFDHLLYNKLSASSGEKIFEQNCVTCHGEKGRGGIALSLNRVDLLSYASNTYLFNTLLRGRGNTGMPSWTILTNEGMLSVVKYIRTWYPYSPQNISVIAQDSDPVAGGLKYHYLCSRCHGESGQSQTGPAIINKDFMDVVADAFLYQTIANGRSHTAMFGWSTDVYNDERLERNDIGNIISFLRAESSEKLGYIFAGANPGNKEDGRTLFERHCSECHGIDGEGVKAPALNNQELLSAASNGYILATLTIGREGTEMPRWGNEEKGHPMLKDRERVDIVAYVRSWQRISIKN